MKKESSSFLKKRTKKLLFLEAAAATYAYAQKSKVFCFFSSEKKALLSFLLSSAIIAAAQAQGFSLKDVTAFPFVDGLVAAQGADRVAWVRTVQGVRNVWVADGPSFTPRQVTRYTEDDGQELTQLTFSPYGSTLLYVRGGDHDENWPAEGDLAPDPAASPVQPKIAIWKADISGKQAANSPGVIPTWIWHGRGFTDHRLVVLPPCMDC